MAQEYFLGDELNPIENDLLNALVFRLLEGFESISEDKPLLEHVKKELERLEHSKLPRSSDAIIELTKKAESTIRDNGWITKSEAQYFLVAPCHEDFRSFKIFVLAVALRHYRLFGDRDRIKRALQQSRLIMSEPLEIESKGFLEYIKSNSYSLRLINKCISRYLSEHLTNKTRSRFMAVDRIIEDVISGRVLNKRHVSEVKGNDGTFTKTGDEGFSDYQVIVETSSKAVDYQDIVEYRVDQRSTKSFIEIGTSAKTSSHIAKSSALSAINARNKIAYIERREKRLPSEWNELTKYEIETLVKKLSEGSELSSGASEYLKLVLLTGRRPDEILNAKTAYSIESKLQYGNSYIGRLNYWCFQPRLPLNELVKPFYKLVNAQRSPVTLPLPQAWATTPKRARDEYSKWNYSTNFEKIMSEIEEWISKINKETGTRLTLVRIQGYLSYYLTQLGVDLADLTHISGDTSQQYAGVYYYQYRLGRLVEIYNQYLEYLGLDTVNLKFDQNVMQGGSRLQVTDEALIALFEHLRGLIEGAREINDIPNLHNYYTLYVLHLLNLATGHRPVNDPFNDLSSYDDINHQLFISDKEVRNGNSSRIVVLPEIASRQLDSYLNHLRKLKAYFADDKRITNNLSQILSGNAPILFFIGSGLEIEKVKPSSVKSKIKQFFDVPLNWHRHYLRTFLSNEGEVGEHIDEFMGHANLGQEGFSDFSGLSINALKRISKTINEKLLSLSIQVVEGWHYGK